VHEGFSFKHNPGFIFHDSPGFEAGGEEELMAVMSFIQERANSKAVEDQIHAIWCSLIDSIVFLDVAQVTMHSGSVSIRMYLALCTH
jgi:hypothetical protein